MLQPLGPCAALLIAAVVAAAPHRVSAATDTVARLEYQADAQGQCAGEDELRRMVADQLGHDPFRPEADQRVAIAIAKTEGGFQARIVWTDAEGRRVGERLLVSHSRDCHEIAANVAFAVALQLQLAERAAPTAKTVDEEPPRVAVTPERPRVAAEAPVAPPVASPARVSLAVGMGPAIGIGLAPDPTALARLFLTARRERLSGEIAADAALPATQREPDGTGVIVNAMGASAAGCGHLSVASACLLGRVGWLRARGTGVAEPSTSWGRFGEVGMRIAAGEELGRFVVSVHADALVMLSRWHVTLNEAVVWNVPRIAGLLGLDLALRFF